MISSGIVDEIKSKTGNIRYDYYIPLEDNDQSDETITVKNGLFSEFYVTYESFDEKNPNTGDNIMLYITLFLISIGSLYYKFYHQNKHVKNK